MSSIAYVSKDFQGRPDVYTTSVQGFREWHGYDDDRPVVRRENWWRAMNIGRVCGKLLFKKSEVLEEINK
jgi:hypothetical protein